MQQEPRNCNPQVTAAKRGEKPPRWAEKFGREADYCRVPASVLAFIAGVSRVVAPRDTKTGRSCCTLSGASAAAALHQWCQKYWSSLVDDRPPITVLAPPAAGRIGTQTESGARNVSPATSIVPEI